MSKASPRQSARTASLGPRSSSAPEATPGGGPADIAARHETGPRKSLDLAFGAAAQESSRQNHPRDKPVPPVELTSRQGPEFWRSLDELADTTQFREMVEREFPQAAAEWSDEVSRRRFLQLMSASLAFGGLAACTRQPLEKIVPYVDQPEHIVPGEPLFFATSTELDGFATGLLVESHMGRPTKIEGNPTHPASLGATDLFAQASVLDLFDPDRNQTVKELGRIRTWDAFSEEIREGLAALEALGSVRLRVLTGTVTSPSLADAIGRLLEVYPEARWHQYQPVGRNGARIGDREAFGRSVGIHYDCRRAEVVLALGSDFLTQGAGAVRYARDFLAGRRFSEGTGRVRMNRLYCLESTPSATGTLADHRVPLSQREIDSFALELAAELGVPGASTPESRLEGHLEELVGVIARDLQSHRGRSAVVPGDGASPALHTLCHAINAALENLGQTVLLTEPIEAEPVDEQESIRELVTDMAAGEVDVLVILSGNPIYDAPADLNLNAAMSRVPRRVHLSTYENETSEYCQWVLPEAHFLESWGDSRAFDGTVSMIQPLIEPLYGGKTALELLWMLLPNTTDSGVASGEEILKTYWKGRVGRTPDPEALWRRALHDGFWPDSAEPVLDSVASRPRAAATLEAIRRLERPKPSPSQQLELVFQPDPTVWDGRFSNNGWLQECPKPLTKLAWDNAALISPALAKRLGLQNGQIVELVVEERTAEAPVWILPGQATDSVTVTLGYGRTRSGRVGNGSGFDAYRLRGAQKPWVASGLRILPTPRTYDLASTQLHNNIEVESRAAEDRHLVRMASLTEFEQHPDFAQHIGHDVDESLSLYESWEYEGHAWGLSVDLGACTGCNACVIACQSENNIPVVGKDQVAAGREMQWIRIDRYYQGDPEAPTAHHQPVMCMHCEQAPCEVVCPVAATVHSDEGLNDMVYNRCVGTRYCSNNCPYKVRRFNFLKYNDTETPVLKMLRNPDVTVRSRGVMEKCTYCVQRISSARIEARKENRKIRDGEVVTACQQVCPTEAIVFGDVNDPSSRVSQRKKQPLDYGLLTELGTRPRTTYLAKVTNPNPDLEGEA